MSQEESDSERLRLAEVSPIKGPQLTIFSLDDRSPLDGGEGLERGGQVWGRMIEVLRRYPNLQLRTPTEQRTRRIKNPRYQRLFVVANSLRRRAEQAYRDVELERSIELFTSALKILDELAYAEVDSRDLARLYLQRGTATLEQGEIAKAELDFQRALRLDPRLRLRRGFDGEKTLTVFERALRQLRAVPLEPKTPPQLTLPRGEYRLYGVRRGSKLLVTLQRPEGLIFEGIDLGTLESDEEGDRLARRVWSCIPFQLDTLRREENAAPQLYLSSAFRYFTFLKSPVETFSHFAVHGGLLWRLSPRLAAEFDGAWGNSNRDARATLRDDLRTLRSNLGFAYLFEGEALSFQLSVGLELSYLSGVQLSSVVGCKHFSMSDRPPPAICDFKTDIRSEESSLHLGPTARLGLLLPITDGTDISLAFDITGYIYDAGYDGLGAPLGGWLGVRYALF